MEKTSIYHSSGRIDELKDLQPRKISTWVKTATECFKCNSKFTWFFRKHHCRSCGRIFCNNCSSYYVKLNNEYEKYPIETMEEHEQLKRVCKKCYIRNEQIQKIWTLINVFVLIEEIDLIDLLKMSKVCHMWHQLYIYYISKFREIQFHLPTYKLSEYERRLLWNNKHLLYTHNKYYSFLIKEFYNKDLPNYNRILRKCSLLKCAAGCKKYLTPYQVIDILLSVPTLSKEYERYFILCFKELNDNELYCLLPIMKKILKKETDDDFARYIIARINANVKLREEWYTSADCGIINLIQKIGKNKKGNQEVMNEIEKFDSAGGTFSIPLFPGIKFKDIDFHEICVKNSHTQPIIIPFIATNEQTHRVMYKKDSVVKDKIISNIIKLIDIILEKNGIDLEIKTYNVFPINNEDHDDWVLPESKGGLIEIIENAETICDINMKKNFSIQNYIIEHNPKISVDELRRRFIKSTAAYCIITYLLGIGDRHLDNIMITHDGLLFHIDFDYVLGADPKIIYPMIRITSSMIDAMGGKNSKYYDEFKSLCIRSYECLRNEYGIIMNMLSLIEGGEKLEKHIINRFLPGQTSYEAKIEITSHLDDNDSYSQKVYDLFHYYKTKSSSSSSKIQ